VNLALEKRAHFFGFYWAIRGGFDNLTNHANAAVDTGTIDSQHPGPTYIDAPGARLQLPPAVPGP
jgi:hypothetical protein